MRLFIASDIHGSEYYCKKMIESYEKEKCDKLILLGDLLYHGPRNDLPKEYSPKAVIEMLNAYDGDIMAVRGNCDTEVDQMVLNFPCLSDYALMYIKNHLIYFTHGHIFNEKNMPKLKNGDILLHGHTHIPCCREINSGKNVYLNPGSVSIPKENSHNGYMIIDDNDVPEIQWKDFEGNIIMKYDLCN